MKLLGARSSAPAVGVDELPGKTNYFIGNDPKRWRNNVPTYAKVAFRDVYPGVTLIYYGAQGKLEFDLVCSPGADPKAVRLAFEGPEKIEIDSQGDLALQTPAGRITIRKPFAYQDRDGVRQVISAGYVRRGAREIGFDLSAYDRSVPLVVDSILVYSTHIGTNGGDNEHGSGIAVDSAGSVYVSGITMSTNFPITSGALRKSLGMVDAFVTKLNPEGTGLVYSTYLGGSGYEDLTSIKVDAAGNAYLTGRTYSNVPVALAVDAAGNAYITGYTNSGDFPVTPDGLQLCLGLQSDAFVTKIDPAGGDVVWSTFLGSGRGSELASAIAIDSRGDIYLTGDGEIPITPA